MRGGVRVCGILRVRVRVRVKVRICEIIRVRVGLFGPVLNQD